MQSETLKPEDCDYTNAQELLTMLRDPIHEGAEAEIAAQFLRIHREPAPPADSAGLSVRDTLHEALFAVWKETLGFGANAEWHANWPFKLQWQLARCDAVILPAHHIAALDAEIARLRAALRGLVDYCEGSGWDRRKVLDAGYAALNPETGHD